MSATVAAGVGTSAAGEGGLLGEELAAFERTLGAALAAQGEYLTEVEMRLYAGGKRLRPRVLMLSARAVQDEGARGRPLPDKAVRAATSLEMLHVASLVHDDIVDRAEDRRGAPSVSAARGRDVALVVGDLQFVQALRCFADAVETERDMQLVRMVLAVGYRICCGQLDEMAVERDAPTAELRASYMRTADRKTAILFALACECGAALGGGGHGAALMLGRYGRALGRSFQIMDDLRDLVEPAERAGKPRAADLAQGRLSLPLILAGDGLPPDGPARAALRGERLAPAAALAAAAEVAAGEGFTGAYAEARRQALRALAALRELPPSDYTAALRELALEVVDRGFADRGAGEGQG
jgi:heptaprenyl diphosphate synthase